MLQAWIQLLMLLCSETLVFLSICRAHSDPQSVLFDGLHIFAKAQILPFDKAEVVIVADTSRSLYKATMLLANFFT